MSELFGGKFQLLALQVAGLYPNGLIIDGNVQRDLQPSRVKQIATYVQNAVDSKTVGAFFAPIVVNKRKDGTMAILDGQHRYKGIGAAIDDLERKVKKLSSQLSRKNNTDDETQALQEELANTKAMLSHIRSSELPVMVYQGLETEEERQLFHDLNNLSKKAPTSLALLFDSSDPFVRIAKEAVALVQGLEDLVDHKNTNKLDDGKLFLFSTIHKSVVRLLGKKTFNEKGVQFIDAYNRGLDKSCQFFEIVLNALPDDATTGAYLYKDAKVLQGVAEFVNKMDAIQYVDGLVTLKELLKTFSFSNTNHLFATMGGANRDTAGFISFKGTGAGISAVVKTLSGQALRYDSQGVEVTGSYSAQVGDVDETDIDTPDDTTAAPAKTQEPEKEKKGKSARGAKPADNAPADDVSTDQTPAPVEAQTENSSEPEGTDPTPVPEGDSTKPEVVAAASEDASTVESTNDAQPATASNSTNVEDALKDFFNE